MNYVISVLPPGAEAVQNDILQALDLPLLLSCRGRGTATRSMRELLGIDTQEKYVSLSIMGEEQTAKLIEEQRRRLYIDAPVGGITVAVPVKSVGGGKTLAFLNGTGEKQPPELNPDYELILVIATEGHIDTVMDAARSAGARGGTALHAKGTGAAGAAKFYGVSIAAERELVLIVAKSEEKAAIMREIVRQCGPGTEAGAIVFSLPVTEVAGFGG